MASFDASINLTLQGSRAVENEISKIEKRIDELNKKSQFGPGGGRSSARIEKERLEIKRADLKTSQSRLALEEKLNKSIQRGFALETRKFYIRKRNREEAERELAAQQKANAQARSQRLQNIALGAGFPLLFGGGAGSVIGGALGGGLGNFGAQIALSAIGQQIDQFVTSVNDLSKAFSTAAPNVSDIVDGLGASGSQFDQYLQSLEEVGDAAAITAETNRRLATIVGQEGADAFQEYGDEIVRLEREMSIFFVQISAGFATLFKDILKGVTDSVAVGNALRQAQTSDDPRLQEAAAGYRSAARTPGFLGGGDALADATENLLGVVQQINDEEEDRLRILNEQKDIRYDVLAVLDQERLVLALGKDLTDEQVFLERERLLMNQLIVDQADLYRQYAEDAITKSELLVGLKKLQLGYEQDLVDLADRRQTQLDREQAKADRAAAKADRERKRQEEHAKRQLELYEKLRTRLERQYELSFADNDLAREKLRIGYEYLDILKEADKIEDPIARTAVRTNAGIVRDRRVQVAEKEARKPFEDYEKENRYLQDRITLGEREADILRDKADLQERLKGTDITPEEIENLVRRRADLTDQLERQLLLEQQIDAVYKQLGQTVVSVFDEMINSTKSFNEILTGTLRQLSSFLLQAGFNALGNSAGQGSVLNTLFGARAMGGPVSAGQPYLVGERGPELFVPSQSGGIMANSKMGGGEVNYVQNIYITDDGSSSEGDAGELGRLIESSVVGIIQREKRPGGMLG